MDPIVSVVVVAKNEEKHILDCIESIIAQDFPKDKYEVTVVDAASDDRTQEIVRKYPVKLIVDNYGTIAHQRNMGVDNSKGKYVAFIDADCTADKFWLKKLVATITDSPSDVAGAGGPNLVMNNDPVFARIVGYMQEGFWASGGSPQSYKISNYRESVISIPNCNIIYKKEIVAKERYDDSIQRRGEDCDLNFRLRQNEYRFIYLPDAIVWHHRPNSFREFVKMMFSDGAADAWITKKHKKIVRWYHYVPVLAILALIFAYPLIRFVPWFSYVYAVGMIAYVGVLLTSTWQVYQKCKEIRSLLTLILLPAQHFSYGFGFIKGIVTRY